MRVEQTKRENLTQDALMTILRQLRSPRPEEIISIVEASIGGRSTLEPFSSQDKIRIGYKERASATKFNSTIKTIVDDLNTLYGTLAEADNILFKDFNKARSDLNQLEKRIEKIVSKADGLLLQAPQTEGLLGTFIDDFRDLTYVDLEDTTSQIDTKNQAIYGAYTVDTIIDQTLDISAMRDEDISVLPLDPNVERAPGTRDGTLKNMITKDNRPWIYTLRQRIPAVTAIQVVIDFARASLSRGESLRVNKIALGLFGSSRSTLVSLQYSTDGEIWRFFEDNESPRRIVDSAAFFFPQTSFRYLRIVLSKDNYDRDSNGYYYDFGIDGIELTSVKNTYKASSEFYSTAIFPPTPPGADLLFSKASLNVCETTPPGTDIKYSIAGLIPDGDSYTQTQFFDICPENRSQGDAPKIVDFSTNTDSSQVCKIDQEIEDLIDGTIFRLAANSITETNVKNIYRNLGSNRTWRKIEHGNKDIVEAGWKKQGRYYTTVGFISDPSGQTIDFGPAQVEIDGAKTSGQVRLSYGIHTFKVTESNWYSVEGLTSVSSIDGKVFSGSRRLYGEYGTGDEEEAQAQYQVIDPLYPFNHKLLIEGLVYSQTYQGPQKYRGVNFFAAEIMNLTNETLLRQEGSTQSFAISRKEDSGDYDILVKWTATDNATTEDFKVETGSAGPVKGLILKAVLKTVQNSRTPSLEGYEIRVI